MPEIIFVQTNDEYRAAAGLFLEYATWLNIDLSFQNFEQELQSLPGMYALPNGGIFLAKQEDRFVGCVAVRKISGTDAELKRLYIQPAFRKMGIAAQLLKASIQFAGNCGYEKMKLDTLDHMTPAITLYKKYGFYETASYYYNPNKSAVYLEKTL